MPSIYETPSGWGIDYRDEWGRRKRKVIGSEAAARAMSMKIEEEVSQARRALAAGRNINHQISLNEGIGAYLNFIAASPRTRKHLGQQARQLSKHLGPALVQEITPLTLEGYAKKRAGELAPSTLSGEIYFIKRLFTWLHTQWYTSADASTNLKPPIGRNTEATIITYEEERRIEAAARPRTWLKILLALDSGLRHSEANALRRSQVNIDAETITTWTLKSRHWRTIPLTRRLQQTIAPFLRECSNRDMTLLNYGGKEVKNANSIGPTRRDAAAHFRFHELRHTFATRVAAVTTNQEIVRVLLGHNPRTNTARYIHPTPEELRAAIDAMERANPNCHATLARAEASQPHESEDTQMPGKRYTLEVNNYGILTGKLCRVAENQDPPPAAGTIWIETKDEHTRLPVPVVNLKHA